MPSRRRTPTAARRALLGAALVGLLSVGVAASGQAAPGQTDERTRREQVRGERADAAAELDALTASDDELEAAVAALQADVSAQEARVADARRAAEGARAEVERVRAELAATEAQIAELRDDAKQRAIESYLDVGAVGTTSALGDGDPTDAERRRALLETVSGSERDVLDQLRGASARLEEQQEDLDAARAQAEAAQEAAEAQLSGLERARAAEASKRAALQVRITEFRAEVDALAAEEDALTAIIDERASRAEQARRDAAAAAAARSSRSTATTEAAGADAASSAGSASSSAAPAPSGGGGMVWPAAGSVTSGYGPRWGRLHAGLDISAPTGTPIYAARSGTVIFVGVQSGYGNLIIVDHGGGMTTAYAHQSSFAASQGQSVSAGQLIGYVGSTGRSTGPHLHFEVRINGTARDPMGYL